MTGKKSGFLWASNPKISLKKAHSNRNEAINDAPDHLRENLNAFVRGLKNLSNGKVSSRRPLERAHIKFDDYRYLPQKKHGWVEREFLIRELTSEYMYAFVWHELKTKSLPESEYICVHVVKDNLEKIIEIPPDKYIAVRSELIIHADVIKNFLSLIDPGLGETDERKIQHYAHIQRKREPRF